MSCTSGVPCTGHCIGPSTFLCYINDLPANINSNIKLYADDVLIYRPIRSLDNRKSLHEDLNNIGHAIGTVLASKPGFYPGKCEHIRITNNKNPILSTYTKHSFNQHPMSHMYLGVAINKHLSSSNHIIVNIHVE